MDDNNVNNDNSSEIFISRKLNTQKTITNNISEKSNINQSIYDKQNMPKNKIKNTKKVKYKKTINKAKIEPEKYATELLNQMKEYYNNDLKVYHTSDSSLKLYKLENINELQKKILNIQYQEKCIEMGLLTEIKVWLEPFPDNSLPNFKIKKILLDTLFNIKYITKQNLLESGIGKIIHFYAKNTKENMQIRIMAKNLINKWKGIIIQETRYDE